MMNPPSLKAIAPVYASDDRYTDDCHYCGGALRAYYDTGLYGNFMVAMNALPPYREISGECWESIWKEHLQNQPWQIQWLRHQVQNDYWDDALGRKYNLIRTPTFVVGGWRDGYPNPPLRLFSHLKVPRKLLIGPWAHVRPNEGVPGPRIDLYHELLRWFAYWLKGVDTGVMNEPPISVYVQRYDPPRGDREVTSGYWRYVTDWPAVRGREIRMYLEERGILVQGGEPATDGFDTFEYVPTAGVNAGLWSGGWVVCLPVDQREDDSYSLTYTSEPFDDDVEVFGYPVARLHVSSSARVAFFVVRLCDVAPDGTSALVCKGVLNATRRDSLRDPKPLDPGRLYTIEIPLDAACWLVEKGHRIRLSISGSDWPNIWPSPLRAVNRVYRGPIHRSELTLPTATPQRPSLPHPSLLPASQAAQSAGQGQGWRVIRDQLAGIVTVVAEHSSDATNQDGMEFSTEERMEARASSTDPAQCSVKAISRKQIKKEDATIEVTSTSVLSSTADALRLIVELEVRLDGREYFRRAWDESFPRNLL